MPEFIARSAFSIRGTKKSDVRASVRKIITFCELNLGVVRMLLDLGDLNYGFERVAKEPFTYLH